MAPWILQTKYCRNPLSADYADLFPQRNDNPLLENNNPGSQNAKKWGIVFAIQFNNKWYYQLPVMNTNDNFDSR